MQPCIRFPVVSFFNGNSWVIEPFNTAPVTGNPKANWTMDYGTGIITLNVDKSTLDATGYHLDSTSSLETDRPRISFIKYIGPLGGSSSRSGSGSGSRSGSNANIDEVVEAIDASMNKFFFDVPKPVIGINKKDVLDTESESILKLAGIPEIHITWTNPEQKCAAFDFYHINSNPTIFKLQIQWRQKTKFIILVLPVG